MKRRALIAGMLAAPVVGAAAVALRSSIMPNRVVDIAPLFKGQPVAIAGGWLKPVFHSPDGDDYGTISVDVAQHAVDDLVRQSEQYAESVKAYGLTVAALSASAMSAVSVASAA